MKRRLLWLMLQVGVVLTAVGMGVSLSLTNWLAAAGWFIAFCYAYYLLTKP